MQAPVYMPFAYIVSKSRIVKYISLLARCSPHEEAHRQRQMKIPQTGDDLPMPLMGSLEWLPTADNLGGFMALRIAERDKNCPGCISRVAGGVAQRGSRVIHETP